MLFPVRLFLAHRQPGPHYQVSVPTSIPLCDLRDLRATLSPLRLLLAHRQPRPRYKFQPPTSIPP
jgi:hypothetical protein